MKNILLLFISSFLIIGCATGAQFQPVQTTSQNGILYVYRISEVFGIAYAPAVQIDGYNKFQLKANGYKAIELAPGPHTVEIINQGEVIHSYRFDVAAGENYYLRHEVFTKSNIADWQKRYEEFPDATLKDFANKKFKTDQNVVAFVPKGVVWHPGLFFVVPSVALNELKTKKEAKSY